LPVQLSEIGDQSFLFHAIWRVGGKSGQDPYSTFQGRNVNKKSTVEFFRLNTVVNVHEITWKSFCNARVEISSLWPVTSYKTQLN